MSRVISDDDSVHSYHYPTVDECAPSLIDTLRIVRKLLHRDEQPHALHYVHCLAGRGRSATMVAAYILCFLHQNEVKISPDAVIDYLKRSRAQVAMSCEQKQHLRKLHNLLLLEPNGLAGLYKRYERTIRVREELCRYAALEKDMLKQERFYLHARYCLAFLLYLVFSACV